MVYVAGATDMAYAPAADTVADTESAPDTARGLKVASVTAEPPQVGSATPVPSATVPAMLPANPIEVAVITGCITHFPEFPAWCPKLWLTSKSTDRICEAAVRSTEPPGSFTFSPL